jgi:RHS repeat-associated protein
VTRYTYFEDGTLKSLTDANGHRTRWDIDVESRPIAKHYADGTTTTYSYEITTSRLASVTDALGQTKNYQYALDDRLAGISYRNAVHPTPNVAFTYDPYFPRLTAMTDGTGRTSYSYVAVGALGALRLEQESSPLPNGKITYAHDPLGRVVTRAVAGADSETFEYDKIGRLVGHTDPLGKFALSYLGETGQMTGRHLVGSSVATAWSYLPNIGDRRLAEIANKFPNERQFHYTTTAASLITRITEEKSGRLLRSWDLGYDRDNRLLSADSSAEAKYGYTLDPAGNITKFAAPSGTSAALYNQVNELTMFAGTPFTYDADGNLLSDGVRTYGWDAENRLIAMTRAGVHSSFAYDGLDRRVAITDAASGRTTTTHYIWCGRQLCQSRNGVTNVQRLYYPEGEVIAASKASFYYGPDQLGSVRDVYAKSSAFSMVQSYDYDPYGNPTTLPASGPLTDFRYAGLFYHTASGLYLTQYRAYHPRTARWLSRDPIGEFGGINARFGARHYNARTKRWTMKDPRPLRAGMDPYGYVKNDPVGQADPTGLGYPDPFDPETAPPITPGEAVDPLEPEPGAPLGRSPCPTGFDPDDEHPGFPPGGPELPTKPEIRPDEWHPDWSYGPTLPGNQPTGPTQPGPNQPTGPSGGVPPPVLPFDPLDLALHVLLSLSPVTAGLVVGTFAFEPGAY